MPLMHGKSEKAFKHNIEAEMHTGKPQKQSLAIAYAMKKRKKKMAEGGEVDYDSPPKPEMTGPVTAFKDVEKYIPGGFPKKSEEEYEKDYYAKGGMVDRIMAKRMSEGGKVSNEEDEDLADFDSNEFDDLVLDDDLEEHYTDENSGDELGDHQEDEDRKDMISRIMRSRAKKDRLPSPR